jgi:serine/threonine-protein kinase
MTNLIGRQLDNYRIESLLGEGGMGSVYRATDVNLARTVAVKVGQMKLL